MDTYAMNDIIEKFRIHAKDTSSADVKIGIYTEEIRELLEAFQMSGNPKYRLEAIVRLSKRRKLLNFLSMTDQVRFQSVKEKVRQMT